MIEPDYAIRSDAADETRPPLLSSNQIVVVERYFSAAGAQRAIAEFRVELWQKLVFVPAFDQYRDVAAVVLPTSRPAAF